MMKESDVKYLAGLIDADGWCGLKFQNGYVQVKLGLSASESIDREGQFIRSLPELTGCGSVYKEELVNPKHSDRWHWTVGARADLEKLLPRFAKHCIIKANLLDGLLAILRETKGLRFTDEQIEELKLRSQALRRNTGPLKPKNFLSWAYVAGYLDGDGHYKNKFYNGGYHREVSCVCHPDDRIIVDYLIKCFNGTEHVDQAGNIRWRHSLGLHNSAFAEKFLSQMARYSKLKKHKIDLMLHGCRQRLSERRATAQATV